MILDNSLLSICERAKTYPDVGIFHRFHPVCGLDRTGTDGFGTTLAEQTGHRCFVGKGELSSISVVGQLQDHLEVRIRRYATLLHQSLTVGVVHVDAQVHILSGHEELVLNWAGLVQRKETYVEQLLRSQVSLLDSVQRYRMVKVERKAFRFWWFKLWNAEGVSVFVVSVLGHAVRDGKEKKITITLSKPAHVYTHIFVQFNF